MADPTARDLYDQLVPSLLHRQRVARTALQVVVAAVTEQHADARAILVQVRPDGAGFQMVSVATEDDVHPWRRTAGDTDPGSPVDVLTFATTLLALEDFFEAQGNGRYWVDLDAARRHLSGDAEPTRLEGEPAVMLLELPLPPQPDLDEEEDVDPPVLDPVTLRFTLQPGVHPAPLGRAVIETEGWRPRADQFHLAVRDGAIVVDVTARPLHESSSLSTALTFGVFAPGEDRGDMADDPDHGPGGDWSCLTDLGTVTLDGVEYTVIAEFNED